jgi:hypothetical protein
MLGWEVFVSRQETESSLEKQDEVLLARWTTGIRGLDWIDDLIKADKATDLGGNGYPFRYSSTAGVLLPILTGGLPPNSSPAVIGDDYVLPPGWNGNIELDLAKWSDCPSEERLVIEAWDQS